MHDTKTVQILKSLTRGELKGLKHFLHNPYFNKNEELKFLFDFIYSFLPGFKATRFSKEEAFKKVYRQKAFDQKQINHLLNKLNSKIDRFLATIELSQDSIEVELKVLDFYQKRMVKYFDNQLNRVNKLNSKNLKGVQFFNLKQNVEYKLAEHYCNTQPFKERNLESFIGALDHYTTYRKLTVFCDMLNHSLITNYSYDLTTVNAFVNRISIKNDEYPQLLLWKNATYILLKVHDQSSINSNEYFEFKSQLLQEKLNVNNAELRNLVTYLRTILKRTNFEEEQYYLEQFSLYEFGLEHEIYFINGYLNYGSVKNIITFSIRANEVEWLDSFLTDYRKHFPKDHAKELEAYGRACIQFERKEYDNVIKRIEGWEFKDIFLNLGKRILTIKVYYELEDVDLFLMKISNLRRIITYYIDKQKITNSHSKAYLDFCMMILAIDKIIKKQTQKIEVLEPKIKAIHLNKLPEKKWLLEKLGEKR